MFIDPHYQAGRLDDERQLKPFIDWLNTLPEKKKNKVYEGMTLEQLCKTENMQQYCAMWEGMDYACELMRKCWDIYSEVLKERAERKYLAIRAEAEKTGKFEKSIIPDGVDFWEYVNEHWEKAPSCIQPYNYY